MYIRTKDGVYEVESDYLNNKGVWVGYNVVGQEEVVLIENNNIIQSENLEELCDEFVLFYMETKNLLSIPWATYEQRGVWKKEKEHIINEITNHPPYRKPILYGAIWTSKGLIYVAKMNENGDLELI